MKIIKDPREETYESKTTCYKCQAVLEFCKDDIFYHPEKSDHHGGTYPMTDFCSITCPICASEVAVDIPAKIQIIFKIEHERNND